MTRSALCFFLVVACAAAAQAQQDQPDWSISELLVKDVGPVEHFVYMETETSLGEIAEALQEVWAPMIEAENSGAIRVDGPGVFVYTGMTGGPDQPFTLQTGFPVAESNNTPDGASRGTLPAFHAATFYYTGALANIGQAYGEVFRQLDAAGHQPTGQNRELYLFWHRDDSPNNVIEIQIGIQPD